MNFHRPCLTTQGPQQALVQVPARAPAPAQVQALALKPVSCSILPFEVQDDMWWPGYYHATGCNWTFSGKTMLDLASASKSSKSKSKSISFAFCLPPGTKPRQEHTPKTSACWRRFIEIPGYSMIPQCHKTLKNYSDFKKIEKKQTNNESSWDFTIPKYRIKNTNFSEISSACRLCCHDGRIRLADHLRIICTREIHGRITCLFSGIFYLRVKMCFKF